MPRAAACHTNRSHSPESRPAIQSARVVPSRTFRVASANGGGQFHVTANGVNVTGPVAVPSTGGAEKWSAVVARGVRLRGGEQFLKLYVEADGADVDWMQFRPAGQ